jgi:tellurite resistance protein TerC
MPQTQLLDQLPSLIWQLPLAANGEVELWHWGAFGGFVIVLLVADLFVFHRQSTEPTLRESAIWTVVWCLIALAFNGLIWYWRGAEIGVQFLTGYLLEWSLSMDNVFIFALLFAYFKVPLRYQYRVLFWGILGAISMRLGFILAGKALLNHFDWVLPLFGVLLVYQGGKMAFEGDEEIDPEHSLVMKLSRRMLPIATGDYGERFLVREDGRRKLTRLFLVLLVIEWTDVVFAVDSVPAIFGVTLDPFTIFTSNIFAILGLRALYFLLAGVMDMFRYLKYGLSAVLVIIGLKMIVEYVAHHWYGRENFIPNLLSLAVVVGVLAISIGASLWAGRASVAADDKPDQPVTPVGIERDED